MIGNSVDRNHVAGTTSQSGYNQYRDNSGVVRRCRTVTDYDNNRYASNQAARPSVTP